MRRLATALVLATGLFLSGCASWQQEESAIVIACETATSALKVATVFKAQGKLSASQIVSIDSVLLIITPICGAGTKPSGEIALGLVQSAVFTLAGVNTAARSK